MRTRSPSNPLTWRADSASRPVSGSSRMIRRGSCTSAPASATFWRMPLENPSQRSCRCGSRPSETRSSRAEDSDSVGIDAPEAGDESEIFQRRQLVVDHRLVGNPGHDLLGGDRVIQRIDPEYRYRSGVGPQQAGHHAQGRGLAGAVRPEQRIEFARRTLRSSASTARRSKRFVNPRTCRADGCSTGCMTSGHPWFGTAGFSAGLNPGP